MSPGKLAAQCAHVSREIGRMRESSESDTIVVLGLSKAKFDEMCLDIKTRKHYYIQVDSGRTEVEPNTPTACGFAEDKPCQK